MLESSRGIESQSQSQSESFVKHRLIPSPMYLYIIQHKKEEHLLKVQTTPTSTCLSGCNVLPVRTPEETEGHVERHVSKGGPEVSVLSVIPEFLPLSS